MKIENKKNKNSRKENFRMSFSWYLFFSVFIFFSGLLLSGVYFAKAETYYDCYSKCINEGKGKAACEVACKPLDKNTTSFNGVDGKDLTTTSTTEGYTYYQNHGSLNPETGEMVYAQKDTSTATVKQPRSFNYILLESFPGFFSAGSVMTDFPGMILAIYKFGIWTVGIAGLFMLVIGGFMYMASAGNTSTAGSARGIIADALLGIVAALGAYLILYVINPDLTKLNLNFTPVEIVETSGFGVGGGSCAVLQEGPCSVDSLSKTCFGSNAEAASKVCNYESGGNTNSPSKTDIGADKNIFSWGLFQINLTQHGLEGLNCQDAYSGKNYSSIVINRALYDKCKIAASTAMTSINYACKISNNGANWRPWENTRKACGL